MDDDDCDDDDGRRMEIAGLEEGFEFFQRVPTCLRSRFSKRPIVCDTSGNLQVITSETFPPFSLVFCHKTCQNRGTHLLFPTHYLSQSSVFAITRGLQEKQHT